MSERLVYLDHAATTAVRPPAVTRAVVEYLEQIGVTPGRSSHRLSLAAGRVALRCRQALAELLDIPGDTGRIAFTHNATHALNTALRGVVRAGDRFVVTAFDHNAVLRPAHQLTLERDAKLLLVPGDFTGALDDWALDRALEGARLLVITAVNNVLGTRLDVAELTRRAHAAGALVLVDGAQLAGHVPFSVAETDIDMLALTGHKGLLGPQGVGALWVHPRVAVEPLLLGGSGGDSMQREMPAAYPDHLEAGTLNGPGIAGLAAGVDQLQHDTVQRIHDRLAALKSSLRDGLAALPEVGVHSPAAPDGAPIVTITTTALDPATLAQHLDRDHGVLVRAGLHCAPEIHRLIGTAATGAVRFSLGWNSTEDDVQYAVRAVEAVISRHG